MAASRFGIVTLGVMLGALAGAAAASVLYGIMDASGFGHTIFRNRWSMLLIGIGTLPLFTLAGAVTGGIVARRFSHLLTSSSTTPSAPSS